MNRETPTLAVDCQNRLGEMPVWCDISQSLYWVDVVNPGRVYHWNPETDAVSFWDFDGLVTGVSLVVQGGLLVHGRNRLFRFDPSIGRSGRVIALSGMSPSMRLNDGRCDRLGRLWVGTMQNNLAEDGSGIPISDYCGQLRMIGDGIGRTFDESLGCPNALCWSPDGDVFYAADSCSGWIYAYRFNLAAGTISERRDFCNIEGLGIPDGAAVDQEGYIWNARWGVGGVARISPGGKLDTLVRIPASQPTACCFGGRDRRTLYITSARFGLSGDVLRSEPLSGAVFAIRVEVPGLELPRFVDRESGQSISGGTHENNCH